MDLSHAGMAKPAGRNHDPYPWVKKRIWEASQIKDVSRVVLLSEVEKPVDRALPKESLHLPFVLDAADRTMVEKESILRLYSDIVPRLSRGEAITSLTFNTLPGREDYGAYAIKTYLGMMGQYPVFRHVVFLERGRYVGWMSANRFHEVFYSQRPEEVTRWINRGDFDALRRAGMQSESIPSTATVLDALRRLHDASSVDDRHVNGLGVIGPDGQLVGIATADGILNLLTERAARR
jgi:hypothetical protein